MMYLILLYAYFHLLLDGWNLYGIAALIAIVPVVTVVMQLAVYSYSSRFTKAQRRLKRFFKHNSYLSSVNLFLFNKKVTKVFPKHVRKEMKNFQGGEITGEEICTTFENYRGKNPADLIKTACVVHLAVLSVVMAVNGFPVSAIAFAALGVAIVWWIFGIALSLAKKLYRNRESKKKGEFIYALRHNVKVVTAFSLGSLEDVKTLDSDSVNELAKGVESFLAGNPDKSLAKVVLKSLYSANYTAATSRESVFALKEAMHKLKNYVL